MGDYSYSKCAKESTDLSHLTNSKSVVTLVEVSAKYHKDYGDPIPDPAVYQKLVGRLIYFTMTHSNVSFVVKIISQFTSNP